MRTLSDNIATIVAGVIICALVAATFALARPAGGGEARYVVVHDGEGKTHVLDLTENCAIQLTSPLGTNVVEVADGTAHMAEADCPTGECLRQLPISEVGQQIICMPHRVWLEVTADPDGSGELDASRVRYRNDSDVDLESR